MTGRAQRYVQVALDGPFSQGLTYALPEGWTLPRGTRVLAPFRQGVISGLLLQELDELPEGLDSERVRPLVDAVDAAHPLPAHLVDLIEWLSRYYHVGYDALLRMALPRWTDISAARHIRWAPTLDGAHALPPEAAALLDEAPETGVLASRLLSACSGLRYRDIGTWEVAGWVESRYAVDASRSTGRIVHQVTLLDGAPPGKLGPRQQAVLRYLESASAVDADELREALGVTLATLRSLEKRGCVHVESVEVPRDPFASIATPPCTRARPLTAGQAQVLEGILPGLGQGFRPTLLHGVTGSGKTEVYLRACARTLEEGRKALVLLPEIGLTPQAVALFRSWFGGAIAVLHSGLTPAERQDAWHRTLRGDVDIVIGARSALFAPLAPLGLVVVDEEHDSSYKQEEGVRYNARDAALVLGRLAEATVVLGSATPSIETWTNATRGRYAYHQLSDRTNARPRPEMEIVDLADHPPDPADPVSTILSAPVQVAVRSAVHAGEQAILFLNRRGYAPHYACTSCGQVLQCPDCDVALTWHQRGRLLRCHWCGYGVAAPDDCPTCGGPTLTPEGIGTQQVEELVATAFEDLRVARMDRDSARGGRLLALLDAFRGGEYDVLVGTQMVTKGHDFPNVTLVAILQADQALRLPDFRSGERAFQLFTQVAGRAGRADKPGRVLLQTWQPNHPVIVAAAEDRWESFLDRELRYRSRVGYPPFGHLVACKLDGEGLDTLTLAATELGRWLEAVGDRDLHVVGPVDAPLARLRGRYRMHLLLKARERAILHRAAAVARRWQQHAAKAWRGVRLALDIDPYNLL